MEEGDSDDLVDLVDFGVAASKVADDDEAGAVEDDSCWSSFGEVVLAAAGDDVGGVDVDVVEK